MDTGRVSQRIVPRKRKFPRVTALSAAFAAQITTTRRPPRDRFARTTLCSERLMSTSTSTSTVDANPRHHPPERSVFESSDLDVWFDAMSSAYGTTLRPREARSGRSARHTRSDFGSFCVDDVEFPSAGYEAEPRRHFAVFEPRTGWVESRWAGGSARTGPGEMALIAPPDRPYRALAHTVDSAAVLLDWSLLLRVAGFGEGQPSGSFRFTGVQPPSPGLAAHWKETAGGVRDLLARDPGVLDEPLVISTVARTLATSALDTFPNTGGPEPTSADGNDATPGTVRRAVAFIEENAHTDIGLTDIAAAVGVTPHALRLAFARHHCAGVFGCLRRVRLARAHFELLAADAGDGATVAGVAARWGFAKSSSFAACYRGVYGVSADDTLAV